MRGPALWIFFVSLASSAAGPVLRVETRAEPGGTGTMHYTDELRVSVGDTAPLVLASGIDQGAVRPIPGPQYSLGGDDVLLIGWSSQGSGMQTVHALLFHIDGERVALRRELTFTGDRQHAGFVMRRDGPGRMLLGIPQPSDVVHEEDEWALRLDREPAESLKMEQIRKLPFVDTAHRDGDQAYFPPVGLGARASARVAWIAADASGFAVSTGAR